MSEEKIFDKIERIVSQPLKHLVRLTKAFSQYLIKRYDIEEIDERELTKRLEDFFTMYVDKLVLSTKSEFFRFVATWFQLPATWWLILRVIYETGVEKDLNVYYVSLDTYLEPGSEVNYDFQMYVAKRCCICPVFRCFAPRITRDAKITIIVNRSVYDELLRLGIPPSEVEWTRDWDNKIVVTDMSLSATPEIWEFAFVPKARAEIRLRHAATHEPDGYAVVEFPYFDFDLKKAAQLTKSCWMALAQCFAFAIRTPEEFRKFIIGHEEVRKIIELATEFKR